MDAVVDPLGHKPARIESEYLERLNKVRFGLDQGWRPPGLLLKGGTSVERTRALERLKELAVQDGFWCSYIALGSDLSLRDTWGICEAAIEAAGLAGRPEPVSDPHSELRRLAASSRQLGRNGWVLLIDNVDRFDGVPRARAESYRELVRWMGTLPGEHDAGLFAVLAVTPEFQQAVTDPCSEFATIHAELHSGGSPADLQLLDAAEAGIGALDHETMVGEILVLEW